jgi:hypothetical protein
VAGALGVEKAADRAKKDAEQTGLTIAPVSSTRQQIRVRYIYSSRSGMRVAMTLISTRLRLANPSRNAVLKLFSTSSGTRWSRAVDRRLSRPRLPDHVPHTARTASRECGRGRRSRDPAIALLLLPECAALSGRRGRASGQ